MLWFWIPTGTLDSFMWGSYPASLWTVGYSTQVPVRAWNKAWKGTWSLPPPIKLERRHMTCTVLVWRKPNQANKQTLNLLNLCIGFAQLWIWNSKYENYGILISKYESWTTFSNSKTGSLLLAKSNHFLFQQVKAPDLPYKFMLAKCCYLHKYIVIPAVDIYVYLLI
jgi:hypothetical protein